MADKMIVGLKMFPDLLMRCKSRWYIFIFTIGVLVFANTISTDVLVDSSFLPRFFLASLLLLIVCIIRYNKSNYFHHTLFVFSFVLFYILNLLSCLWAISASEAIMQSQLVFMALAVFLTVFTIIKEYEGFENIFIKTHLFTLIFSFALALYQMFSLDFYDPYKIVSISANNNLYSGFLLLSLPLVARGYLINKSLWRYLSLLLGIFTIFFIIILQSRAVYIGLLFSMAIFIFLVVFRYRSVFTKKNILISIASTTLLLLLILIFYFSLDTKRQNYFKSKLSINNYASVLSDNENTTQKNSDEGETSTIKFEKTPSFDYSADYDRNANLRVIFWKKSLCLIKSNPILGVGAGNWRINIQSCKNPPNPEHTMKNYSYSQPHNEWICIISELGIVGFILSLFVYIIPLIIIISRILIAKPKPNISVVIYASFIIGFYVYSIFDFPLRRVEHNVLFFSIMAFLLYKMPIKSFDINLLKKIPQKVFSAIFILVLIFSLLISIARIEGEYYTVKMFKNERKNDNNVIYFSQMADNVFYRITPYTLPLAWFEGVAFYRLGDITSAYNCFVRAVKSTPFEVRVLNDYAASLHQLNKTKEAKAIFLQIIDIDPYFDDAKYNLATIYYFSKQKDSALIYINKCRNCQKKEEFLKELN